MTIIPDVEQWSKELSESLEILREILQLSHSIEKAPVDEVSRCLDRIQELCDEASSKNFLLMRGLDEIARKWGITVFQKQSNFTSNASGDWMRKLGTAAEKTIETVQIFSGLMGGVVSGAVLDGGRFGWVGGDDLVAEAGLRSIPGNEENIKKREEEIDRAIQAESAIATEPAACGNNFSGAEVRHHTAYNYLDELGGSVKIEAKSSEGKETGFITAERTGANRVKIKDTIVPKAFQKRGIASELLSDLESKLPQGTELYFEENQAPEFWEKKGFKSRVAKDTKTVEYYKLVE